MWPLCIRKERRCSSNDWYLILSSKSRELTNQLLTNKDGIEFVNHNDGSTLLISRGRRPGAVLKTLKLKQEKKVHSDKTKLLSSKMMKTKAINKT